MKLKFNQEIQTIIDAIAARQVNLNDEVYLRRANGYVADLEKKMEQLRSQNKISVKEYVKIRRQISFIWEFYRAAMLSEYKRLGIDEKSVPGASGKLDAFALHNVFVESIKKIQSGEILTIPTMVRLAMRYGVLQLSDHEVKGLIERNKV